MAFDLPAPNPLDLLSSLCAADLASLTASQLLASYSEPHRRYHTLSHIAAMLQLSTQHGGSLSDAVRRELELAVWFHDCIYDPELDERGWNEERSREVWEGFARQAGLDEGMINRVSFLITCTISHLIPAPPLPLPYNTVALFLDLDLAVLAFSPDEYASYAWGIRAEYAHYSDADFRKGRAAVLRGFLGREKLFISEAFAGKEEMARENLRRELEVLEDGELM